MRRDLFVMNPLRWILLGGVLICLAFVVVGCASLDYYQWQAGQPPCDSITWVKVEPEQLPGLCYPKPAGPRTTCALNCVIVSPFSEEEAKHLYTADGNSIWNHEVVMHAVLGMKHQQTRSN